MHLQGHLLYIDITQICGIGCAFCMYADKHKVGISMELSTLARENLARLINTSEVKRISISGEGEPLNNAKVFQEILGLSKGGKCFEFITSGFHPHDKMEEFYDTANRIVLANGDTCNIRLSADSHHIDEGQMAGPWFQLRLPAASATVWAEFLVPLNRYRSRFHSRVPKVRIGLLGV